MITPLLQGIMHPYLIKLGSFELRIYSLMIMLAVLIGLYFIGKRAAKLGIDRKIAENCIIATFIGGIIGARAYYVIFNLPYFMAYPSEILAVWHGGLAIHGGIILGFISMIAYCRVKRLSIFTLGDLIAPFILLGQGFGRIGNFANGEAHGVPTVTPPEIIFQIKPIFAEFWRGALAQNNIPNTPAGISYLYDKILAEPVRVVYHGGEYLLREYVSWGVSFPSTYGAQAWREFGTMPVHPTFFYEMILNFIGAAILITLWRRDKNIGTGRIMALYVAMYAMIRGFVTFFRADDLMFGALRAPHMASLALIVVSAGVYLAGRRWG